MSETPEAPLSATEAAQQLAKAFANAGCDYALGGAIALGFWSEPRGTVDVDVTLFIPPSQPSACIRLLQSVGCTVQADRATQSIADHGFCQVEFRGRTIDVFLPTLAFYDRARDRRRQVVLGQVPVTIWDAETLCVFKMMFFRRKDIADLEQLLRLQGSQLDRAWVLEQLTEICGDRDPRISQWNELTQPQ